MKWSVVFAATFIMLSHDVMSYMHSTWDEDSCDSSDSGDSRESSQSFDSSDSGVSRVSSHSLDSSDSSPSSSSESGSDSDELPPRRSNSPITPNQVTESDGPQGSYNLHSPYASHSPHGPYGPHGPRGPYGPHGTRGTFWPHGPRGPYGPHGPRGPYGPHGSRGPYSPHHSKPGGYLFPFFITTLSSTTESVTTKSTTKPTLEPTIKPTTEPTTKPPTEPTTKPPTEPTTKPPTEPTTEPPTKPTTKPQTEPTTKPPMKPITKPTTVSSVAQDIRTCILLCPLSSEYNPVCGTNLVTYNNPGYLLCEKHCGIAVDIMRTSPCPPTGVNIGSSTQPPTTTTTDVYSGVTLTTSTSTAISSDLVSTSDLLLDMQSCVKNCPVTSEHNPVCGTNDVTFKNPSLLECFRACGLDVQIKQNSPCFNNNGNIQPPVSTPSVPTQATAFLSSNIISLCINACPTLTEDKPICGTDGVTYKNPSHLQCAKVCGVRVQMKQRSPCPYVINTGNPVATATPTPPKSDEEVCIAACQKGSEYNPVCGSNNVTYKNLDHLQCAISCHVDVTLVISSPCSQFNGEEANIYVTSTKTSTESAKEPEITESNNSFVPFGPMIPQYILDEIFLQPEYNIDIRLGEVKE